MKMRRMGWASVLSLTALLFAGGALLVTPDVAAAECKITCEKCKVNLSTGQAECENCTITGCEIKTE
jgi:hypothetical protein